MLEILCGMIGSGKSTYARKRADQGALCLSHDELSRMVHGGRPRYEPGLRDCYRAMLKHLAVDALAASRDVIVDRTHLTRESRREWIALARTIPVEIAAVVFPIHDAELHAQRRYDADPRERTLEVWREVARHHAEQAAAEPLDIFEGFNELIAVVWDGGPEMRLIVQAVRKVATPVE